MYNRNLRQLNNILINHKLSLTKIKNKNGVKAICFAEVPFVFRIKNFTVKDFNKFGFISIFTKNNLHQKLNSLYQIFSEIENQVINVIFENRFQWCNGLNIPRYQFEEAFHQPIKIKNNETVISCHYESGNDITFIKLLNEIQESKKLVTFVVEYEGFELSESDIFPLFKITEIKGRETKFSKELCENDSSEENTEIDIYPTDIETKEPIGTKENKENKGTKGTIGTIGPIGTDGTKCATEANEKKNENEIINDNQVTCDSELTGQQKKDENDCKETNINSEISLDNKVVMSDNSLSFLNSESDCDFYDYITNYNNMTNKNEYDILYKNFKTEFQKSLENKKKITMVNKNPKSRNFYVSKVEFEKIKNSKEMSNMLQETVDIGYESQLEKAQKIKIKK